MNDFFTSMYASFSNAFRWLARLPSVTSSTSFSLLKSISSPAMSADMMPSLTLFSKALLRLCMFTFNARI